MRFTLLFCLVAAVAPFTQATAASQGRYIDMRHIAPVHGDAAAATEKAQLCVACHGMTGLSIAPIFPNLSGQSAEYLYWELVEYQRARRPESAMTPLVAAFNDADLRNLAAFYARRASAAPDAAAASPPPAEPESPDPQKLARGERLFRDGDAARGVPPCAGCHGNDAKGHPLAGNTGIAGIAYYRSYPAVRGQKAPYVVGRLNQYRSRQLADSSNDFIMQGVAAHLDDDSIDALATWLSSLSPP